MTEHLQENLRLGIIQTTVDSHTAWSRSLQMSAVEEERVIVEMQQHLASISAESTKAQIILLPELTVPIGFLVRLRRIAAQMNAIIIAGLDFETVPFTKKVMNRAAVIIPNGWGRREHSTRTTIRYVGKTYPAWREEQNLRKLGYEFQPIPEVWIFEAEQYGRFAVAICYDFLDLERVAMYRLENQHLFILAYNFDTSSFDHAAEALARMVFCNIVVCNTGTHGGSIAVSPYNKVERRLIYRHSGLGLSTSQTISLPVQSLAQAQTNTWPVSKPREFKSLPPGAVGPIVMLPKELDIT